MMFLAALPSWVKWSVAGVLGVVLLAALFLSLREQERADDQANQEVGATVQREADQAKTIENVKEANDARDEIKQTGPAGDAIRHAQCLRTARTPANCARYAVPE